jgi:chaperonin GroES
MTVRPMFDRILIQRNEEPNRTKSGLFLPEAAKEKPSEGTILAVGQGRVSEEGKVTPLAVKVGDKVLFEKYSGTEIKIDGEERIILREDDILGILD